MNKELFQFLSELRLHNNREWFQANKPRYDLLHRQFIEVVQELINRMTLFEPELAGLTPKDCIFRIYRDIRFSPDKTPYKTHFGAYIAALAFGFTAAEAGAIGIIGGADGPTAIFLSSRLAPDMMGAIAIAAYSYMALVPVLQPWIMKLCTTKKERLIRMRPPRPISKSEKVMFPIIGLLLTCFLVPSGLPLLGMLFLGNLLKESGVTKRLATTAGGPLIDIVTILIGLTVGASTQATTFLTEKSLLVFAIGAASFIIATFGGVLFVKFLNLFLKEGNKINPLIGNAGVSAVPDSARVSQEIGLKYDKTNHLLMHAMGPNVAGVIGSAVAAGILLGFLG